MSQALDHWAPSDDDPAQERPQSGAPWPLVERRTSPGVAWDGVERRQSLPDTDSGGGPTGRTAAGTRRILARDSMPARTWKSRYIVAVIVLDMVAAAIAGVVASQVPAVAESRLYLGVALLLPAVWVACVCLGRGYESRFVGKGSEECRHVLQAAACLIVLVAIVSYASAAEISRVYVGLALPLIVGLSLLGRAGLHRILRMSRYRRRLSPRILVAGPEQAVHDLITLLNRDSHSELSVVGACVSNPSGRSSVAGVPMIGDLNEIAPAVWRGGIDVVAVASAPETMGPALRQLSWDLEGSSAELVVSPGLVELTGPRVHIQPVNGLPLLHVDGPELASSRRRVKGVLDRVTAGVALTLLLPALLALGVLIRATSRGPALFRQVRVGKDGEPFVVLKFRTMYIDAEQRLDALRGRNKHGEGPLFKLDEDPRVTRVGRVLRRCSLDELPQLINVLSGRMSLVGPRPPLPSEVQTYRKPVDRRLLVKPGLTGLWQVNGRSDLCWDDSVLLDLRYVEDWSLALDASILWKTCYAVLRGRGAY